MLIIKSSLPPLLLKFFYSFTVAVFSWLFLTITLDNKAYLYNPIYVLFSMGIWILVTCYLVKLLELFNRHLNAYPKRIAAGTLSLVWLLQIYCGYQLAVQTAWDVEAVYKGAVTISQQGSLGAYQDYFQLFPHNLGATLWLSWLFDLASLFGIQDYYWVGTVYNTMSITLGFFLVFLICYELGGTKTAFIALWLCITSLAFYFYTPIFYTDTLSLPFILAVYYLYLLSLNISHKLGWTLAAIALGTACAIGSLIKFTVVIIAIAILIELVMRGKIRKYFLFILLSFIAFKTVNYAFDRYVDQRVLAHDLIAQKRVPYSHWIMMGLTGTGAYNGADYEFTFSIADQNERINATIQTIRERLHSHGVIGYLQFVSQKQQLNFGNGVYGINELIDDNPLRPNFLHQIGMAGEKYFGLFKHACQGHHVMIFSLFFCSVLIDLLARNKLALSLLAARTAVVGIYFFLMIWEANSRLIVNYIPIVIICAACGFKDIYVVLTNIKNSIKFSINSFSNGKEHVVNEKIIGSIKIDQTSQSSSQTV